MMSSPVLNNDFFVLVINPAARRPVFHQFAEGVFDEEQMKLSGWRAKCGNSASLADASKLRRDHAHVIGRPCSTCFPDA